VYRLICLLLCFFLVLKVVQDLDHAVLYLFGFLSVAAFLVKLDAFDLNLIFPAHRTVYTYISLFLLVFSRHFEGSMNIALFPLSLSLVLKPSWLRGLFFGTASLFQWFSLPVFSLFLLLKRMWCFLAAAIAVPLAVYVLRPEWINTTFPLTDIPPKLDVGAFLVILLPVLIFEFWKRNFSYPLLFLAACYTALIFPKALILPLFFLLPLTWLFVRKGEWGYAFICFPILIYWVLPSSSGDNDWLMLKLMTVISQIFYWTTLSISFPKIHGKQVKGNMMIPVDSN